MTYDTSICIFCAHYRPDTEEPSCQAFPGRIPDRYWRSEAVHTEPARGQEGSHVFTAREGLRPEQLQYVQEVISGE